MSTDQNQTKVIIFNPTVDRNKQAMVMRGQKRTYLQEKHFRELWKIVPEFLENEMLD